MDNNLIQTHPDDNQTYYQPDNIPDDILRHLLLNRQSIKWGRRLDGKKLSSDGKLLYIQLTHS